jgi:dihydroorotate dehydrogenase electron transfer subunit
MFELRAKVVARRLVAREMVVLSILAPEIAATTRAGQFINIGLAGGPWLRRPFSVYRTEGELVEVVLRSVGTGTAILSALAPGDRLSCLGPLGNGFRIDPAAGTVALVAGGLGVAPMPLAARQAAGLGLRTVWVHGARTRAELCREWEGDEVAWATDDGSQGHHGSALAALPPDAGQVLACGPNPMLAALAGIRPAAQVAIETYMGCGTGVCLGCAVPLRSGGYDRACREGPVYLASEIEWQALPSHLHYSVTVPA